MRRALPLMLATIALAGCGNQPAEQAAPAPKLPSSRDTDPFTRRVVTAMCGTPEQRALAISTLAEPDKDGDVSDDVYTIARQVARKGCPSKE